MSLIDSVKQKMKFSPNRKLIINNIYWAVIGKSVNILSGLLIGVFVARYLGPEQYGLMSYVISYVTLFSVLSTFGLGNIEIRELAKNSISKETILGTALYIRLVLSFGTVLLIIVTLFVFESDQSTFWYVIIYSMSLILRSLEVIRNYFTSIVKNEYVVKNEITRTLIASVIKLVLLIYKFSLFWFIVANTFEFLLIGSGYIYAYTKKVGSMKQWNFDKIIAKMLLVESFPLLLSGAAIIVYQKIDQVMIRNMIDNRAVGQFAVASGISEYVIFIPSIIAQTITPLLVQSHLRDVDVYNAKKQLFLDVMVWSSVVMASCISIPSHFIISFLYGDKYLEAVSVLQIMAWKAVFVALSAASGQLIIIENIQKYAALRNVVGCLVSVLLNLLLIPLWGITGSAIATIVTMSFSGYLSHLFISPYRYLFKLQTSALFVGWKRIAKIRLSES